MTPIGMSPLLFFIRWYLFGNKTLLYILIPVFACMGISKYYLLQTSIFIAKLTDSISNRELAEQIIIYLGVSFFLHSLFDELFTLIALGPIFEITRQSNVKFLETCLLERDLCDYKQGEIARSLIRGSEAISTIIELALTEILPVIITIVFALWRINNRVGILALFVNIIMLAIYTFLTLTITKYRVGLRMKRNKFEDIAYSQALENIRNIDTIITYKTKEFEMAKFDKTNKQIKKYHIRLDQVLAVLNFVQSFILASFLVVFLYYRAYFLTRETLTEYITISLALYNNLEKVGCIYHKFCKLVVDLRSPFIADIVRRIQIRDAQSKSVELQVSTREKVPFPKNEIEYVTAEHIAQRANVLANSQQIDGQNGASTSFSEISSRSLKNDGEQSTAHPTMGTRLNGDAPSEIVQSDLYRGEFSSDSFLRCTAGQKPGQSPITVTKFDSATFDGPILPDNLIYKKPTGRSEQDLPVICLFDSVNITYHRKKKLLSNVNMALRKSQKIAIVGPNGTGKSSFIKSIIGFVPITGQVLISENTNLVYASQETQLFNNTVIYNLTYGLDGLPLEKVINIANKLQLSDRLQKIGYDTIISECGKNLSGGQRQAIVILRSVLKCLYTSKKVEQAMELPVTELNCDKRGCRCSKKQTMNVLEEVDISNTEQLGRGSYKKSSGRSGCGAKQDTDRKPMNSNIDHNRNNIDKTNNNNNNHVNKHVGKWPRTNQNTPHEQTCSSSLTEDFTEESDSFENINEHLPPDADTTSSDSEPQSNTLLLLDEATSAIDRHTEYLVLNSLFSLLTDTTILMVIHNLSYLELFDKIIFIDKDIEFDTFIGLKQRNKLFREFYDKSKLKKEKQLNQVTKQLDTDKKLFIQSTSNLY